MALISLTPLSAAETKNHKLTRKMSFIVTLLAQGNASS